jgi:hypothetical protein
MKKGTSLFTYHSSLIMVQVKSSSKSQPSQTFMLAVLCLGFHSKTNYNMTPGRYALEIGDFSFKRKFFKALAFKERTRLAYLPKLCLTLHLMHTYYCTQGLR